MKGRMRYILSAMLVLAAIVFLNPMPAFCDALGGQKYFYGKLGLADYDGFNDTAASIELGVNFPIDARLDLRPFLFHESLNAGPPGGGFDISRTYLALRGDYFVKKGEKFEPLVGGVVGFAHTEVDTAAEDDLLFQVHGGMDISLSPKAGLRPQVAYIRVGNADDLVASGLLNVSLSEQLDIIAEGRLYLDNIDLFYGVGLAVRF